MNGFFVLFSLDNYPEIMIPALSKHYAAMITNMIRGIKAIFAFLYPVCGNQYPTTDSNTDCSYI